MKKLYQTLKHLLKPRPLNHPDFLMLKCPDFLMKIALDKTTAHSDKNFCYMDAYHLQQLNLLKQIGININQITTNDENLKCIN